ncbi:MAG TPA: ATPase, T2SS/T4P/T4SS family [Kiritimatiellia bacterium]
MRIGEILVQSGRITREQLGQALERQKAESPPRRLGEILLASEQISEFALLEALGQQFGITALAIVDEDSLDPSLVNSLPVDWARMNGVLPARVDGRVVALVSDPSRLAAVDDLALLLGSELLPMLAPATEIKSAIEKCYYRKQDTSREFLSNLQAQPESRDERRPRSDDLLRAADQAPVTQLMNLILLEAVKQRASDVHVEPFEDRLQVRYRIDGFLYEQSSPPKNLEAALVSRLKVMAKLDIAERRLPQDGMASVRVGEREIDIRVSTIPVAEGERVVLRLLNRDSALLSLPDLGMPDEVLTRFKTLLREPNGVILVTGPTGSGKTTTLYAGLQQLDTKHINVLTIEDPIEYQIPGIGQMQVKPKIGLTFSQGLRHILRQDPDVIFVGEIRDLETAEIAVRASLTGHLVFATLHTNDAASAVVRLVDMGVERYLLSAALRGVLAQRLVRKLCPACRKATNPTIDELDGLGRLRSRMEGKQVWKAVGCAACLGGFKGRMGIYELMTVNPMIQEAVRHGAESADLGDMAARAGMKSLMEQGIERALAGDTTVSEILRTIGQVSA